MGEKARVAELGAYFAARQTALLADLRALVEIESPSDDATAVTAVAAYVHERLTAVGVPAERIASQGAGDAVLARIGPATGGTLVLSHIDTVWPVGTLREIPFEVKDGRATGPGVFDMKAGVAVKLAVLEAIAAGAVSPKRGVSALFVPDEEIGSRSSRALIVEEARARTRVLVLEPSAEGGAAKVARKGIGFVKVHVQGVASHAGLDPEKGASALSELSRFVLHAEALARLELGTSLVVTTAQAGTKSNVVPELAEATIDFRIWAVEEGERVMKGLDEFRPADPRVTLTLTGGVNRGPMEPTAQSLALYDAARHVMAVLGVALGQARVGGASDGNLTASAGIPTLDGLGPEGGGAHARSEHLLVDDLPRRAALLAAMLEERNP